MNVSYPLSPVNFPSEGSSKPSPGIELRLFFGYVTRSNQHLYPNSTFQAPEEGLSVEQPKLCDKHGDKDEDKSPKNVNNIHNTSSQKY